LFETNIERIVISVLSENGNFCGQTDFKAKEKIDSTRSEY
jgi:hypothetical protein